MFERSEKKVHTYTEIAYFNAAKTLGLCIIPDLGANLTRLVLPVTEGEGLQLIEGIQYDVEARHDPTFMSAFLFPFPNRIKDGKYQFRGRQYYFDCNEKERNNAIHGIVYNMPFQIIREKTDAERLEVSLLLEYNGNHSGYPFPFSMQVNYSLHSLEGLEVEILVKNSGSEVMPVGFGWHPYYVLKSDLSDFELNLPKCNVFHSDDRMIPENLSVPYQKFETFEAIGNYSVDACFKIQDETPRPRIGIYDPALNLTLSLWQENGEQELNYFVLYTPPSRRSIAVEPMSCCTNAYNSGEGLKILAAGDQLTWRCGARFLSGKI
ncbi:MAG: aldose 1-epimerase [Cyclobacteriaceae bacterium]|nr:aldose 1-epimerase [Cyclobacteriaceae bacterium]